MGVVAQLIVNGLIAGSIYALIALGYTMVYGILKFINFAHGEVLMLGTYLSYFLVTSLHIPIIPAMILAMAAAAILGVVIERVAYRPLRKANAPRLSALITAMALSIFLQSIALLAFGSNVRGFGFPAKEGYHVLGAAITQHQITIIITTIVLMVLLYLFIKKTKTGKAIRATADNLSVASTIGINTNKVIMIVFALGSALATAAGVLVGIEQTITPTMGVALGIKAFTAAVVGGIGNIVGAVVGGFAIGIVENVGIWFLPSGYKDVIAFTILILMLLFRPTGFFGTKKEEDARMAPA